MEMADCSHQPLVWLRVRLCTLIVLHVLPRAEERPRSGFGFELCFRLRRQSWETSPPSWPCVVFNDLARFVDLLHLEYLDDVG